MKQEIILTHPKVQEEWIRWQKILGDEDPYEGDDTIGMMDVMRAHFLIADFFYLQGEGMHGVGPKNIEHLHSALFRQFAEFDGKKKWKTKYEKLATLIFGIATSNHSFHDANKRTAMLVYLYALHKIHRTSSIPKKELEDLMVDLASHKMEKYPRWVTLSSSKKRDDADVLFLADFMERKSKTWDLRIYTVTFQQLDRRLRDFNFCLMNPSGNYIDLAKITKKKKYGFFGKEEITYQKISQIGFPGWKSQVSKSAISTIRREAKLNPENDIDSSVFFHGADPLNGLIDEYKEPLKRLAYR